MQNLSDVILNGGINTSYVPPSVSEYTLLFAKRFGWIALVYSLFVIVYFGRLRQPILSKLGVWCDHNGWELDVVVRQVDRVVLVINAGLIALVADALRHLAF